MENSIACILVGHDWTYERHNSVIVRGCKRKGCIKTQSGIYIEEPELCSWAKTDWKKVIETVKWKDV
jgi:hypothetical protein